MKLYSRKITKTNGTWTNRRTGRRCFNSDRILEVVLTDDIKPFNKHKHIKFVEMSVNDFEQKYIKEPNKVYEFKAEW